MNKTTGYLLFYFFFSSFLLQGCMDKVNGADTVFNEKNKDAYAGMTLSCNGLDSIKNCMPSFSFTKDQPLAQQQRIY